MYNLHAKNNTRPAVTVNGKSRNMNREEYKLHREQNQEKVGPQWELQSTATVEEINFNGAADLRAIIAEQWKHVQQQKGWTLGEEWKAEAADYFSPDDERIDEEERRQTKPATNADDEVSACVTSYVETTFLVCICSTPLTTNRTKIVLRFVVA